MCLKTDVADDRTISGTVAVLVRNDASRAALARVLDIAQSARTMTDGWWRV